MTRDRDVELPFAATLPVDDSTALGGVVVRARAVDTAGALLAQAKVAGALFGPDAAGGLGRFRILERLGAGGMGVVHAAYDPDLDRGVALKLVHVPSPDRDAAFAEAKALARLSHPNVVPIYDVGLDGDYVYLVMELVRGKTLGQWVPGRRRREVLEAYQQAGAALAAAHHAGLVHRDFKPDNAIVGQDGRVRVVDFGLACEAEPAVEDGDRARRIVGTPKYMPPEQAAGATVTARADQYSFCVALAEALAEVTDPATPRWVTAVIARGCAADPAARFETMAQLLKALARDPVRAWRRRGTGAAVAVTIGAIAFSVGQQRIDTPCAGAEHELDATWSAAAQATARSRLASLGGYGKAVGARIESKLAAHAGRWIAENRSACLKHHAGDASDTLFDLQTVCFARSLAALGAARVIIEQATASSLAEVPRAVEELPDPATCADAAALASDVKPPEPATRTQVAVLQAMIARSRLQLGAGRYRDAQTTATGVVAEARATGYLPLLAEALLVEGHATLITDRAGAAPILAEAQNLAIASRSDALAIEAWARRAWAQGTTGDPVAALAGLDIIEPLAKRTPSARFAVALLHNNLGSVELARHRRDLARQYFELALDEARGVTGPGALELINAGANLALITEDPALRDARFTAAIGEIAARLGEDHPDVLAIRWLLAGSATVRMRLALERVLAVCQAYTLHPSLTAQAARCWTEAGHLHSNLGDQPAALDAMQRAQRHSADATATAEITGYIALWSADPTAAARVFRARLAALPGDPDELSWRKRLRAQLQLGLGRALRATGDLVGARGVLQTSVASLDLVVRDFPVAAYERQLGRAQVELALTLAATRASKAEIAAAAAPAVAWLRTSGGQASEIAMLERLP